MISRALLNLWCRKVYNTFLTTENRKKLLPKAIFLLLAVLMLACFSYAQDEGMDKKYVISPNDILEISVYGEPDLSVSARVGLDGRINYAFLGDIKVAGFNIREIEKEIAALLSKDYLVSPQVTVFVKEYAKISILGQVKSPGSYQMKENFTLTQAIALAGGFGDTANTTNVKIIRTSLEKKETLEVDVAKILNKAAPDVEIRSNDTIIVEEYAKISILGQVGSPGAYPMKQNLTLTQAIANAGGFTDIANTTAIKIMRTIGEQKDTLAVDADQIINKAAEDVLIMPNDTIIVEKYGRISIIGQVIKPGVYDLQKGLTVIEAVGLAGGFSPTAAQNGTRVIRTENKRKKIIPVPVADIVKAGNISQDILLQEGDTIVVPESFF